ATWERAWKHFESDPQVTLDYIYNNRLGYQFDINNSMYFLSMLHKQLKGDIDSWAIRWYGSMFMHGGLSLHPAQSLTQNHGFDGSGAHCSITDDYDVAMSQALPDFSDDIMECPEAVTAMIKYRDTMHKPGVIGKLERMVVNMLNRFQYTK
ncbi:MAG: hypothetical protein HKN08_07090, partial [Gammaproteobacteria bacterium]|nr:hypothetical protein [Gammaproteobacteria bacterium]